jgi:serine/threonine protein kinase
MLEETVASVVDYHTFTVDSRYSFNNSWILGVGSYGIVCVAFDKVRSTKIAIKRIRPYAEDECYAKLTLREIRCLKALKGHPNVRDNSLLILFFNIKKELLFACIV